MKKKLKKKKPVQEPSRMFPKPKNTGWKHHRRFPKTGVC